MPTTVLCLSGRNISIFYYERNKLKRLAFFSEKMLCLSSKVWSLHEFRTDIEVQLKSKRYNVSWAADVSGLVTRLSNVRNKRMGASLHLQRIHIWFFFMFLLIKVFYTYYRKYCMGKNKTNNWKWFWRLYL